MTALLQQAFDEASKRSREEQDVLAARLLAELAAESAFDQAMARSSESSPSSRVRRSTNTGPAKPKSLPRSGDELLQPQRAMLASAQPASAGSLSATAFRRWIAPPIAICFPAGFSLLRAPRL